MSASEEKHVKGDDSNNEIEEHVTQDPDPQEDDDEFGDFDEASFEEVSHSQHSPSLEAEIAFPTSIFRDSARLRSKLHETIDIIMPETPTEAKTDNSTLLEGAAKERFLYLSQTPRLRPPNWTKSEIRHSLLVKLGIPIDLDELESGVSSSMNAAHAPSRRRSITEHDIDWSRFDIPDVSTLEIGSEEKQKLLDSTTAVLSGIEEFNLSNTSEHFLLTCLPEVLEEKLHQMKSKHAELVRLSAVWLDQMLEVKHSQEIYELVVQNMVGYSQKLRRNEIYENLTRTKLKLKRSRAKRAF